MDPVPNYPDRGGHRQYSASLKSEIKDFPYGTYVEIPIEREFLNLEGDLVDPYNQITEPLNFDLIRKVIISYYVVKGEKPD